MVQERRQLIDALIFDSGVGGLSILIEALSLRPELSFAYIADTAGLPYGDKSDAWLLTRVAAVLSVALEQFQPRLLVVACNTASTLALDAIRNQVAVPVVGVVPAIKPAALLSKNSVIALLASPATVRRAYTDKLIEEFAGHCQVLRVGSSRLVAIAEQKIRGETFDLNELGAILEPLLLAVPQPDTIVLGCTHFPLLKTELQAVLPGAVFVDSGAAVAQRIDRLLGVRDKAPSACKKMLFTRMDPSIERLRLFLAAYGSVSLEKLPGTWDHPA